MAYFGLQRPFLRQSAANAGALSAPCDRCGVIRSLNQGLGPRSTGHSAPARGQLGGEVSQRQGTSSAKSSLLAPCSGTCSSLPLCVRPPGGSLPRQKGASGRADPKRRREVTFLEENKTERIWDHEQQTLPWGMEPLLRNRK